MKKISITIPCYNEEEVLQDTAAKLKNKHIFLKKNKKTD